MPEDVIELPEHGDAAGPADTAGEAGHADGADGDFAPVPAAQDHFLIDDTIAFIHRTVSEKALEAALLIGDYILTRYFNNDMEAAFSRDPHKSTSFNALCHHPDLRISRYKLVDMVKVAAQERFLRLLDDDFTGLHYSHRLKLTALPNNEIKIDMAKECVDENLTTRQLGYRIRRRVAEMAPDQGEPGAEGEGEAPTPGREPDPAADAVNAFIADLDQLTRQAAALNPESLEPHMDNLPPETRGSLEYRVTALSGALEATRLMCQQLLHRLRPGESEH